MAKEGIIISILCLVIFGTMVGVGINADNNQQESKYCAYGEPLIKNDKLIGCQYDENYIGGEYSYHDKANGWENAALIFGLLGGIVSLLGLVIMIDNSMNHY